MFFFFASCANKITYRLDDFPDIKNASIEVASDKVEIRNSSDITIVSHYAGEAAYLKTAKENHSAYANKHGYNYVFRSGRISGENFFDPLVSKGNKIFRQGLYWQKITAVSEELNRPGSTGDDQWVMWIDGDAVFTNIDQRIEELINKHAKSDTYFIIGPDDIISIHLTEVNAGVFLVKKNDRGKELFEALTKLYPYYKDHIFPEQAAIQDTLYGYVSYMGGDSFLFAKPEAKKYIASDIRPGFVVAPQREINAFYLFIAKEPSRWHAGDFIAHVAGSGNKTNELVGLLNCLKESGFDKRCEIHNLFSKSSP